MRGLIEVGCVVVLLSAANGCVEDVAAPDDWRDAGAGRPPVDLPDEREPSPRSEVPAELVGAWTSGSLDFELWEDYREGYWAGRNASPTREAMIFHEDGSAKFYRYEFAFTLYEELVDCEGTVAFHDDDTFTFYPERGRKRFYDSRYSAQNTDRALRPDELLDPEWAGTRAYTYDPARDAIRIEVPSSAPYFWYRQQ